MLKSEVLYVYQRLMDKKVENLTIPVIQSTTGLAEIEPLESEIKDDLVLLLTVYCMS
jgi:hypothetical protein